MTPFKHLASSDNCEIIVDRRIDGETANQLEIDLISMDKTAFNTVYINLAACNFICSAGLRVILQYHRKFKMAKRKLLISRLSPEADQILELTGFKESLVESV
jgi:anti-anti-sigma factor